MLQKSKCDGFLGSRYDAFPSSPEKESVDAATAGRRRRLPTTMRDALTAEVNEIRLNRRTAARRRYPSGVLRSAFAPSSFTFTPRQDCVNMGYGPNRTILRRGPSRPRLTTTT